MKIILKEINSGKEIRIEFTPECIVPVQDLHLVMYCPDNYSYIGDNAQYKTDPFKQIYLTKLLNMMYGKIVFNDKSYDVQVGCYLNEFNYKIEHAIIYVDDINSELIIRYCNFHPNLSTNIMVKILDYKSYTDLVSKIGNEPLSFKQYILRSFFNSNYIDSPLDYFQLNETSYFNEKDTEDEDDFMTIKGMKIYFEEFINSQT